VTSRWLEDREKLCTHAGWHPVERDEDASLVLELPAVEAGDDDLAGRGEDRATGPSWEFVAVGPGVAEFWVPFLQALHAVDPDTAVSIAHEDQESGQVEGLRLAAESLLAAAAKADVT
jgi:sugar phosphate isomerase/epimerase